MIRPLRFKTQTAEQVEALFDELQSKQRIVSDAPLRSPKVHDRALIHSTFSIHAILDFIKQLHICENTLVFDIGSGQGSSLIKLRLLTKCHVFGVELRDDMAQVALPNYLSIFRALPEGPDSIQISPFLTGDFTQQRIQDQCADMLNLLVQCNLLDRIVIMVNNYHFPYLLQDAICTFLLRLRAELPSDITCYAVHLNLLLHGRPKTHMEKAFKELAITRVQTEKAVGAWSSPDNGEKHYFVTHSNWARQPHQTWQPKSQQPEKCVFTALMYSMRSSTKKKQNPRLHQLGKYQCTVQCPALLVRNSKTKQLPTWLALLGNFRLIFVTWKKGHEIEYEDNHLRGCKGSLSNPQPLDHMLQKFALNSALEDTRFDPIVLSELKDLWCGVSILHSFEACNDHMDWELGKHGISIEFQVFDGKAGSNGSKTAKFHGSAIFLPSVAPEQGWTKEQTIIQLIRKAGYKHSIDWTNLAIRGTRHQSHSTHVSYAEWQAQC